MTDMDMVIFWLHILGTFTSIGELDFVLEFDVPSLSRCLVNGISTHSLSIWVASCSLFKIEAVLLHEHLAVP